MLQSVRAMPLKVRIRSVKDLKSNEPKYEIFCQLKQISNENETPRPIKKKKESSQIQWSIYKTYREFKAFDTCMRSRTLNSSLSKMMVTVRFPSAHEILVLLKQSHTRWFTEKRRRELDYYIQRILMFSEVSDFMQQRNGSNAILVDFFHADAYLTPSYLKQQMATVHTSNQDVNSTLEEDLNEHSKAERQACKLELINAVTLVDASLVKVYKRATRAFHRENDHTIAANDFLSFLYETFEMEFAEWLAVKFPETIKNQERREALKVAAIARVKKQNGSETSSRSVKKRAKALSNTSLNSSNSANSMSSHRQNTKHKYKRSASSSNREILSCVATFSNGNATLIAQFKDAAKGLASGGISSKSFIAFIEQSFAPEHAQALLALVAEAVPNSSVQAELRKAVHLP